MGNRLCDLTHLLLTYGKVAHRLCRIDVDVHSVEQLLCLFVHLLVVNADTFLELTSDEDILCNCQMTEHVQLLMHDYNAGVLSFTCIVEFHFFSFICNCTGIFLIDTCQHLHQR